MSYQILYFLHYCDFESNLYKFGQMNFSLESVRTCSRLLRTNRTVGNDVPEKLVKRTRIEKFIYYVAYRHRVTSAGVSFLFFARPMQGAAYISLDDTVTCEQIREANDWAYGPRSV